MLRREMCGAAARGSGMQGGEQMRLRCAEAVAFDKDGVLADSEPINLQSAFQVFADHGFPLEAGAATDIVGRHPVDYFPVLASRFGIGADQLAAMLEQKQGLYKRMWAAHGRLFSEVRDVLTAVRRPGLRTAIVTSSTRAELDHFLRRFELATSFDVTLSRDDVARPKPDPEIYLKAAARLGVRPQQLLVVEDSEYGVRSARAAGAFCVAIRSAHVPQARIAEADLQIEALADLPGLLAGIVEPR